MALIPRLHPRPVKQLLRGAHSSEGCRSHGTVAPADAMGCLLFGVQKRLRRLISATFPMAFESFRHKATGKTPADSVGAARAMGGKSGNGFACAGAQPTPCARRKSVSGNMRVKKKVWFVSWFKLRFTEKACMHDACNLQHAPVRQPTSGTKGRATCSRSSERAKQVDHTAIGGKQPLGTTSSCVKGSAPLQTPAPGLRKKCQELLTPTANCQARLFGDSQLALMASSSLLTDRLVWCALVLLLLVCVCIYTHIGYICIYIYVCVCVCACLRAATLQSQRDHFAPSA